MVVNYFYERKCRIEKFTTLYLPHAHTDDPQEHSKQTVKADALEALIAAISINAGGGGKGYSVAATWIHSLLRASGRLE